MAMQSAWSGAITFGGFPIHVKAYPILKSKSTDSFKSLCPCHHEPIRQLKHCAVTGDEVAHDALVKGVPQGRGKSAVYHPLTEDVLAQIAARETSSTLDILALPPADSVPWALALGRFRVVPDGDVAGSEGPVNILWNGLIASGRALVSEWTKKRSSRPCPVAIRADVYGLTAVDLPYATDLSTETPEHKFNEDAAAGQMFEQFAAMQGYPTDEFAHGTIKDEFGERRADLIAKALAGEKIEPAAAPVSTAAPVDMLAAMQAALASAKPAPKKARKKAAA